MFGMINDIETILDIAENLHPTDLGILEDVPENYTIGEYDEAREAEAAEVLGEIFTPEVVARWDEMSIAEKEVCLDRYTAELGEILGIGPVDTVITYDMDEYTLGYTSGEGKLYLNADIVNAPDHLAITLNTASHEVRHCFQTEVAMHPEQYPDIPPALAEIWSYNFEHYICSEYDPEGYAGQPVEMDARSFAEGVTDRYLADIANQIFG